MPPASAGYRRILVAAVSTVVTVAYGVLLYGFSVFVSGDAAGADFSTAVLSVAFGGAVLSGALSAVPVGRLADRRGVRGIMTAGALLGCAGMLCFAVSQTAWQVLAAWWLLIGPATAMTFYEPAFVVLEQWFDRDARNRAVGTLTFLGGLAGPIFIPLTGAMVEGMGWRPAAALLGVLLAVAGGGVAALFIRPAPSLHERRTARRSVRPSLLDLARSPRFVVFTVAACLGLAALEAVLVHRVARFTESGFPLAVVTLWAAVAGILSFPGRYALPALANRVRGTHLFAFVLATMAATSALAVRGTTFIELAGFYGLFGLVLGAAIPMRAVVMSDWYPGPGFGGIMGAQAAIVGICRAAAPALVGVAHDVAGGYGPPFVGIVLAFSAAAVLVIVSERMPDPLARHAVPAAADARS